MRKNAIKNRDDNKPTSYYPAGRILKISNVGEFPAEVKRIWKDTYDDIEKRIFELSVVTNDCVYYQEDGDDEINGVVMLNRDMKLISDNYMATNDLTEVVGMNKRILWMSDAIKYWQREGYVMPDKITPEIQRQLDLVNIDKLRIDEKQLYLSYLNAGPAKYTKAESLMAILHNDVWYKKRSFQLEAIKRMLDGTKKTNKRSGPSKKR